MAAGIGEAGAIQPEAGDSAGVPGNPLATNANVLTAALVGTTVEYYDFFIYATAAALVFGPLFFPAEAPAAQTLLSFMSFGIAFFARPVGAIAFGHFGDRAGRKSTLVASLLLMGGATLAIAFLPTYAQAGWIAPVLLCLMRFGQGFALGGEWGGAALLSVENAPPGWKTRFGAAPQLGAPLGFMAANGLFLLLGLALSPSEFAAWGWRVPFLASAVLVVLGLWVRLRITETPEFLRAERAGPPAAVPIAELLSRHGGTVLAGSAGVVSTFAAFYLTTAFALAEATGPLGFDRERFLATQLGANVFFAIGIAFAATLADRTSTARAMSLGAIGTALIGLVFIPALEARSLPVAAAMLSATMFVMGLTSGPLGGWLSSLFPVRVRYSGVSLAFTVGGIVGGALTPIAAQWLSGMGLARYVGGLLCTAGLISLVGVRLCRGRPGQNGQAA